MWPTVTLQPAVRWRTVILVMTMFLMTTRHRLYSPKVRLIRQAGYTRLPRNKSNVQCEITVWGFEMFDLIRRDYVEDFGYLLLVGL